MKGKIFSSDSTGFRLHEVDEGDRFDSNVSGVNNFVEVFTQLVWYDDDEFFCLDDWHGTYTVAKMRLSNDVIIVEEKWTGKPETSEVVLREKDLSEVSLTEKEIADVVLDGQAGSYDFEDEGDHLRIDAQVGGIGFVNVYLK